MIPVRLTRAGLLLPAVLMAVVAALPADLHANAVDRIEKEAKDIEREAALLRTRYLGEQAGKGLHRPEDRFLDGETLYRLGDYHRAVIVLFDFVESHSGHHLFSEAVFFLGDALFLSRDPLNARMWFEKYLQATEGMSSARFRIPAISRLLEIAVQLNDYERVAPFVDMLGSTEDFEAMYFKGKYLYFVGEFEEAVKMFRRIREPFGLYLKACYFAGVARVRQGRLEEAIEEFARGQNASRLPVSPEEQKIVDVNNLGLGRVYLERDQLVAAGEAYRRIDRYSPYYDAALFENAVVHVRAGDIAEAERLLEILMAATPDSVHIPAGSLMRGNLLLRSEQFDEAKQVFQKAIKNLTPVRDQLDDLLFRAADMSVLLNQLLEQGHDDVKGMLPTDARPYLLQEPVIKRAFVLAGDLESTRTDILEIEKLLLLMNVVLQGNNPVAAIPVLREGRYRSQVLRNRLMQLSNGLMEQIEKRMTARVPALSKYAVERKSLSQAIQSLPLTEDDFRQRESRAVESYQKIRQEVSRQRIALEGIVSNVVALEKLMADSRYIAGASQESLAALKDEITRQRQAVHFMRTETESLGSDVEQAILQVSSGGVEEQQDAALSRQLFFVAEQQVEALQGRKETDAQRMARAMRAIMKALGDTGAVMTAIDEEARMQVAALVEIASIERENLVRYEWDLRVLDSESREALNVVTLTNLGNIRARFHDMLLKADVGIIDIAWVRKEKHKSNLKDLTRSRLNEIRRLDEQFSGIRGIPVSLEEPVSP